MKRRYFLKGSTALLAGAAYSRMGASGTAIAGSFEVVKSQEEWRAILPPEVYSVLREEDTEMPGSSPLNTEKRKGTFHCAGCDLGVYSSETKYESGTGWPSFWQEIAGTVGTKEDNSLFMSRIECHCRRCGGHFGHIFDDGPQPTGKRHCINGLALTFRPDEA